MARDPAFLFYPGDYLRDTQMLSEKSQVAYDRIMCEHMRNICITKQQLKFFTKRLSVEEKEELAMCLKEIKGGFQIEWVTESIVKRKKYSESRRNNRTSKPKNTSLTYDSHMENEIEDENIDTNKSKNKRFDFKKSLLVYGFDEDLINDWLIVRKNKKASNTKVAFDGFVSEIEKRTVDINVILRKCIEKSWAGFNYTWLDNEQKNGQQNSDRDEAISSLIKGD